METKDAAVNMQERHGEAVPPSGRQHPLRWEAQHAIVVEVGGGVREYEVAGEPVLDGYTREELCPGAAGAILAPWPNRIREGRYDFGGRELQLPLTEPERGNAIHGLTRWQPWAVVERDDAAVLLRCHLHPQPGYPFSLELTVRWSLGPSGLTAEHTATNVGAGPCPFGLGVHPYLLVQGVRADGLQLTVPATRLLRTDEAGIPTGELAVAGTSLDFGSPRLIGPAVVDSAFTGLTRTPDGHAHVAVRAPDGRGVEVWMDTAFGYVQVFTGDTLPEPRRRRAVAVEPMTCPPDAFRSGTGVVVLQPGDTWRGTWGLIPLRT
ncbi:MAG: aldose 1-epimerase family protein [Myxococcaceae bacterium]|nr:aldose 1-epimerase family protein [Myxococcaceae bacterium]